MLGGVRREGTAGGAAGREPCPACDDRYISRGETQVSICSTVTLPNATRLSIDLFCRGIRIDASCDLEHDARSVRRTRAGLGSGLELCIEGRRGEQWVNVPVEESFAKTSPYLLVKCPAEGGGRYYIADARVDALRPVRLPPQPAWYSLHTTSGREMSRIGVLQGTYLGVYVGGVCAFWAGKGLDACGFCTTGRNVGDAETLEKSVQDVVETARAAKEESGVTFVHLNTGYQGEKTLDVVEPFVAALKERVGVLVGVQSTPTLDFDRYRRLKDAGADHLSFCYEFQDPQVFEKWCPGKARTIGQETYFRALEHCASLFGRGTCAGEIIAGVEPLERTLEAIDWIASVGAFPTVCIFRPTIGSHMESLPSPEPDDMVVVMRAVWDACKRHLVPVGLAPNVRVSLVVNPEDAAELVENPGASDYAWRAALSLGRVATRPLFAWRMRKGARRTGANV
jgi:hypothetical protein